MGFKVHSRCTGDHLKVGSFLDGWILNSDYLHLLDSSW
jgi:hypothetical protein